ncbi:MAG: VOC family protein [Ilumatobacteraceae bacterium]
MTIARFLSVVIDATNPKELSEFWRALLGGEVDPRTATEEWISLRDVPQLGYLSFQKVPEERMVKNRVHLDMDVDDIAVATSQAVAAGARTFGGVVDEGTGLLQVMLAREGNEFCLIQRIPTSRTSL